MPPSILHLAAFAAGAVLCATPGSGAQVQPKSYPNTNDGRITSPEYAAFLDKIRMNGAIPGISVGVVRLADAESPEVQFTSSGRRTEEGDGHDMTTDTLFALASCSKAYLTTSLGILMDDFAHGRNTTPLPARLPAFDWETRVVDLFPVELGWSIQELADGDNWAAQRATLRDLLTHVSGLPGHDYAYKTGDTAEDIVWRMGGLRAAYELRTKASYNNQVYVLGALLVARYSGMPYPDFVRARILAPLNMSASTFVPSAAWRSGRLTHTWAANGRRVPFWETDEHVALIAGAGGLISSAEDSVKWLATWLNAGVDPASGARIFSEDVYTALSTAQYVSYGTPIPGHGAGIVGFGLGWYRWAYGDVEVVQHNGGVPGISTLSVFSPSHNIGVVVLSNADERQAQNQLVLMKTFDTVLGTHGSSSVLSPGPSPRRESFSSNARPPSLLLRAYAGTYAARGGYGPITLCSPSDSPLSEHCATVSDAFDALFSPSSEPLSEPMHNASASLYAAYPSLWATHLRMEPASTPAHEDVFALTLSRVFPRGFGRDTTPFETGVVRGRAEFVLRKGVGGREVAGFGLILDEAAYAARRRRVRGIGTEEGVRTWADAWFEKVT